MAHFYSAAPHQSSLSAAQSVFPSSMSTNNSHHGNRSRRSARYSSSQIPQKLVKNPRTLKEGADITGGSAFRKDYEAARSFDLEDDEIFCPWHLLTDDDLQSIHSSSSDRASSSGSGSPETSPVQPQLQPTPAFALPSASHHIPLSYPQGSVAHLKIHQPLAQRTRNAIPIVDPNSRNTSPPTSVSPARQVQKSAYLVRRW